MGGLEDLQVRFRGWVESEYHRNPHRGLGGATPLERWIERAAHIIAMDPTVDLDHAFEHEIRRKVYRDSTVTLDGVLYEVPSSLIGKKISLRYDPSVAPARRRLTVLLDGTVCGIARVVDSYANARVRRTALHKDLSAEPLEASGDKPSELPPPSATDSSLLASGRWFSGQPEDEQEPRNA